VFKIGGFFGVASRNDCKWELFYGTDYHCHLGTMRGGLAMKNSDGFQRRIHNITNSQFKSKFENDIIHMHGNMGIGVISDYEDQPLFFGSPLGDYCIATVGVIQNLDDLKDTAFRKNRVNFSDQDTGNINPTELVAHLISQQNDFVAGIQSAQESIIGSSSILLLTEEGIYAARDRFGRTPVFIGGKDGAYAITLETCALPNNEFEIEKTLGPGEIVLVTQEGVEQKKGPNEKMQICSFLWVYYGFPASSYEGISVEKVRNRCGVALAKRDKDISVDLVAGIPDSGTGHAIGYVNESGSNYGRPFVKYTPTWPRSFMPQEEDVRNLVAKMKLIPSPELIRGKRLLFCEDSIVRGTQLTPIINSLHALGAEEIHIRPACPPLIYMCEFLNFSRSKSDMALATRKAMRALLGKDKFSADELKRFSDPESEDYKSMVDQIRKNISPHLTTLRYQRLSDLVKAIGLPKDQLCTHCWDGSSYF